MHRFWTLTLAAALALWSAGTTSAQTTPEACDSDPVDTVSSGRLALFDVYWDAGTETLNNNPCPPTGIQYHPGEDDGFGNVTPPTTTRTASSIDIGHTIIHIPASARQTVTADGEGDYDGENYTFLRQWTDADSALVWILPGCRTTPAPPFCLSFSAGLLHPDDWNGDVQYKLVSIRHRNRGHQALVPANFFVFYVERGTPGIKWRTDEADTNAYQITPGTYEHPYWAFTAPGTYELQVQVTGHPNPARTGGPLTRAETVTSEVRRYTVHVGRLTLNEQPRFQVSRAVRENAPVGTAVGAPIAVTGIDGDILDYWLTGEEPLPFAVFPARGGAQLTVAAGAVLDFETQATYDLTLHVSDDKDRVSTLDYATDDTIAVHITLEDDPQDTTP